MKEEDPAFLTIAYGKITVIRSLPNCSIRDVFEEEIPTWVEVDVPLSPQEVGKGVSFRMRVVEEFPTPGKPSLLCHRGGAHICYTGLESKLWLKQNSFRVVDPNPIHYGFQDGQLDAMGRLVQVDSIFPRIPLEHRIVQAVMDDGRTVLRRDA